MVGKQGRLTVLLYCASVNENVVFITLTPQVPTTPLNIGRSVKQYANIESSLNTLLPL